MEKVSIAPANTAGIVKGEIHIMIVKPRVNRFTMCLNEKMHVKNAFFT